MTKKILLVDDSITLRTIARATLEDAGYEVVEAENGINGLEVLNDNLPDLIVSDINMPEMNGLEFVNELRKIDQLRFIPVILLTTESSPDQKQKAKLMGVRAWITKPLKAEQLLTAISKLLPN